MIVPFIAGGAWEYANSRPVTDTSTSASVSTAYGNNCQRIDSLLPPSSEI